MFDRQLIENGKPVISPVLIFHRTSDNHIIISIVPVLRNTIHEPINTLCQKQKTQIGTLPYHLPAFRTPFIGILNQKIRGKAQVYSLSRFYFVCSRLILGDRGIELTRLYNMIRINPTPGIALMNVTVPASLAMFVAAAPRNTSLNAIFSLFNSHTNGN